MLAGTPERMDFLQAGARQGPLSRHATPRSSRRGEAKRMLPADRRDRYFLGALYDPLEGHLDPSGIDPRLRQGRADARRGDLPRNARVGDSSRAGRQLGRRHRQGHDRGRARRQRRRPVGARGRPHGRPRAAGARHGAPVPHLRGDARGRRSTARPKEVLHVIDFEGEIYLRQEGKGMLLGTYERAGVPWSPEATRRGTSGPSCCRTTSTASRRASKSASSISRRIGKAGIKRVVNGPFTFAPDGNPLVGPVRGLRELLGRLRRHGRASARAAASAWRSPTG